MAFWVLWYQCYIRSFSENSQFSESTCCPIPRIIMLVNNYSHLKKIRISLRNCCVTIANIFSQWNLASFQSMGAVCVSWLKSGSWVRHCDFSISVSNFRLLFTRHSIFATAVVNISQKVLYLTDRLSCTMRHHNLLVLPRNCCETKHPDCFLLAGRLSSSTENLGKSGRSVFSVLLPIFNNCI